MHSLFFRLILVCFTWQVLSPPLLLAMADVSFEVQRSDKGQIKLTLKEKEQTLLDRYLDDFKQISIGVTEYLDGMGITRHPDRSLTLQYISPSTDARMDVLILPNGDIKLQDNEAVTLNNMGWTWKFKTLGTLTNTANLLFHIIHTDAREFHNFGIIKALTGKMCQTYKFNNGVFDFGDSQAPENWWMAYADILDGVRKAYSDVVPQFDHNTVDDYGIFLSKYGHLVRGLTYRVKGIYINDGCLTLERAQFVNQSTYCVIDGILTGEGHRVVNEGALYVGGFDSNVQMLGLVNEWEMTIRQPCTLLVPEWINQGDVFCESDFNLRTKKKMLGAIAAQSFSLDLMEGVDEGNLSGSIQSLSGKMKIKKRIKIIQPIDYITVYKDHLGLEVGRELTGHEDRLEGYQEEEEEIDLPADPLIDFMLILQLAKNQQQRKAIDQIKDNIRKNLYKLATAGANKNALMCGLMQALAAAELSNEAIEEILSDPEIESLLGSIGGLGEADEDERGFLTNIQTDSGSILGSIYNLAHGKGLSAMNWVVQNPGHFMDLVCGVASVGRAVAPQNPVVLGLSGLCGARQSYAMASGGRIGPKARGCLVQENQKITHFFRDPRNSGNNLPGNLKIGERISNVSKQESPVWRELKPYKGEYKTNTKGDKFYKWDHLHNDIEVFKNSGGRQKEHIGTMDPTTGRMIRQPVKGRRIIL